MIQGFKHKGLGRFFTDDDARGIQAQHAPRLARMLDLIDAAENIEELNLPGYALHPLKGDRKGEWSMKVSGNWRITFSFTKGNAFDLNLEDYH
jgi:proteic killer suppression protein